MFKDMRNYLKIQSKYIVGKRHYIIVGVIFSIIAQLATLSTPFLTRFLIDTVITQKDYSLLMWFLFISLIIVITLFITSIAANYFLVIAFKNSGLKLKIDIFKSLQQAPLEFFGKTPSGEISYRLLQDADVIENSWSSILVTLPLQFILLLSGVIMAIWNLHLALFVFFILFIQVIVISKFRAPLLRISKDYKMKSQEISGYVVEHFNRIQLIRSLSTEMKEQNNFLNKMTKLIKIDIRSFMLNKFSMSTVIIVNNLWSFGILWYGGSQVINGTMTLGTLMAFLLLSNLLYAPISTLTNMILEFQNVRASLLRFIEYTSIKPKIIDSPTAISYIPKKGKISFKNVSFGYDSHLILDHLNLEIKENTIVALVGKSGVGKTTLCRLLVRFFDSNQGEIYIDEKNIKDITLSSLRHSVLLMLQNNYVFSGTIWDNITYGLQSITKKEVDIASKQASLDFIKELPNGYDTKIGEGGINLSVGETQRIALARAFLFSPKVLILDEPTSFIDAETENKIINSLLKIKEKSTIILIGHRISTVMISDKIAIMEKGKIAEIGTHKELIKKENGIYRKIYLSILSK